MGKGDRQRLKVRPGRWGEEVIKTLPQVHWYTPVIPPTWRRGAQVGGSWSKAAPGKSKTLPKKNNESKKGWRQGSSGTVLAEQAQGPEFNPQYQLSPKERQNTKIYSKYGMDYINNGLST
jgi:hypothetical protein